MGLTAGQVKVFEFVPLGVALEAGPKPGTWQIVLEAKPRKPNAHVFHVTDARYGAVLASCLKNHLARLAVVGGPSPAGPH